MTDEQIAALLAENERLRRLDAEAATYVEVVICMRTAFDGEPPYVGWKGLGLALTEALDERDRLRAEYNKNNISDLIELDVENVEINEEYDDK